MPAINYVSPHVGPTLTVKLPSFLLSQGGFPYPTISDMNLLNFLLEGNRMDKPSNCSDEM